MDCTTTGASDPTRTLPMVQVTDLRRVIVAMGKFSLAEEDGQPDSCVAPVLLTARGRIDWEWHKHVKSCCTIKCAHENQPYVKARPKSATKSPDLGCGARHFDQRADGRTTREGSAGTRRLRRCQTPGADQDEASFKPRVHTSSLSRRTS